MRMAPSSAYLLLEDQPAMNTAMVLVEPMAMMNSTPTLRSASTIPWPKGNTANTTIVGMKMMTGPSQNSSLSALRVVMGSFSSSLKASAIGCRMPVGPTRLGPIRFCISPTTRRSIQMKASTLSTVHNRMASTPISDDTTYGTQSGAPHSWMRWRNAPTALPMSRRSHHSASGAITGPPRRYHSPVHLDNDYVDDAKDQDSVG